MRVKAIAALVVLACAATAASATDGNGITVSADGMVYADHAIPSTATGFAPDIQHKVIFSNLASKYPLGLFDCCYGFAAYGSNNSTGRTVWFAVPFTPATDAVAAKILVPVFYDGTGTNEVVVALYDDNAGLPGTELASGTVSDLPMFGQCCAIASVRIRRALTGGATYWVAVLTDGANADTEATWASKDTDQVTPATFAQSTSDGTGWQGPYQTTRTPAIAVIGE